MTTLGTYVLVHDRPHLSFIRKQKGKPNFYVNAEKNVTKVLSETLYCYRGVMTSLTFFILLFAVYYLGDSDKY